MLWLDRLRVILRTLGYREAWRLRPRQSLGMLRYLRNTRPTWRGGEGELNVYAPAVGGPAYARYLDGLGRMGRGQWTPLVAHLAVTDRCPYQCRRCSNLSQSDRDPPLDALVRRIEELRAAGACRVALTGGEPLERGDLPEIVRACGPELSPVLFTSGHGLAAAGARRLREAGLAAALVSLDHFLAEEHDRLRGAPGAFAQALAAIRAFRAAGVHTAAQAVVGPSLAAEGQIERFAAFCRDLGADEVMLLEEVPVRDDAADARADAGAVRRRLAAIHLRSARDRRMPKISSMSWLEGPECLGCQAGFSFLYVAADGEVFPCDFAPLSFGNLDQLGLPAIHDRMVRALGRPSAECFARRLRTVYGISGRRALSSEIAHVLRDYDPGPAPKLLPLLCDGCHDAR